ncbi:hypothetical protein C2G38_2142321 [Gigaspora rosea]|uniref:Uncharacterized protein n=1 Tax=Gigaspora rosea TaxID=44941 RepID=A0A397V6B9_9GLOM|nr:hypothetical protein C2G38_2142321 [Gigaspora rosea]
MSLVPAIFDKEKRYTEGPYRDSLKRLYWEHKLGEQDRNIKRIKSLSEILDHVNISLGIIVDMSVKVIKGQSFLIIFALMTICHTIPLTFPWYKKTYKCVQNQPPIMYKDFFESSINPLK